MERFHKIIRIPYIIGIALLIFCMFFLLGCDGVLDEPMEVSATPSISTVDIEYSEFELAIDKKTNVVYIDNKICTYDEDGWKHYYHIYTPYYSGNGKICTYKDGKVVEIE